MVGVTGAPGGAWGSGLLVVHTAEPLHAIMFPEEVEAQSSRF